MARFVRYQAYQSSLWPIIGHFGFDQAEISQNISLPETAHFVYSNGLAIWSGFPDITHTKKITAENLPFWPL